MSLAYSETEYTQLAQYISVEVQRSQWRKLKLLRVLRRAQAERGPIRAFPLFSSSLPPVRLMSARATVKEQKKSGGIEGKGAGGNW